MNAMEENKAEKGDATAPLHVWHETVNNLLKNKWINKETVNNLLRLITEMEIYDQSPEGRKGENPWKLLPKGKQGRP